MVERDEPALTAIADGVHAWVQPRGSWWVNNAGAVVTPDGTLLVDTCVTERRTRVLLRAVSRAACGGSPALAVNTRARGEHSYGNRLLPESTVIISRKAADPGYRPPAAPTARTLHIGKIRVELLAPAELLTPVELLAPGDQPRAAGALVAWLPEQGVLFTGDLLFNQVTPVVFTGNPDDSSRVLEWISEFQPEIVVPGHGPLVGTGDLPEILDAHQRYYQLVAATAHAGVSDGLSPLDAARRCDLGAFSGLPDADRLILNLHYAYADITGIEFDYLKVRVGGTS
jgi:cyclase